MRRLIAVLLLVSGVAWGQSIGPGGGCSGIGACTISGPLHVPPGQPIGITTSRLPTIYDAAPHVVGQAFWNLGGNVLLNNGSTTAPQSGQGAAWMPAATIGSASYAFGPGLLPADIGTAIHAAGPQVLRQGYVGNLWQVVRASDGTTQNVGSVNGSLDYATLEKFCSTSALDRCRIINEYGQMGTDYNDTAQAYFLTTNGTNTAPNPLQFAQTTATASGSSGSATLTAVTAYPTYLTAALVAPGVPITVTGTNLPSASFTGSLSGTTLTTSNVTGTVAIGQMIYPIMAKITAGSGSSWTVAGATTTSVGSNPMTSALYVVSQNVGGLTLTLSGNPTGTLTATTITYGLPVAPGMNIDVAGSQQLGCAYYHVSVVSGGNITPRTYDNTQTCGVTSGTGVLFSYGPLAYPPVFTAGQITANYDYGSDARFFSENGGYNMQYIQHEDISSSVSFATNNFTILTSGQGYHSAQAVTPLTFYSSGIGSNSLSIDATSYYTQACFPNTSGGWTVGYTAQNLMGASPYVAWLDGAVNGGNSTMSGGVNETSYFVSGNTVGGNVTVSGGMVGSLGGSFSQNSCNFHSYANQRVGSRVIYTPELTAQQLPKARAAMIRVTGIQPQSVDAQVVVLDPWPQFITQYYTQTLQTMHPEWRFTDVYNGNNQECTQLTNYASSVTGQLNTNIPNRVLILPYNPNEFNTLCGSGVTPPTMTGNGTALSGGSGGTGYTNGGPFQLAFSGGGCGTAPTGTYTVTAGIPGNYTLTAAGIGCSSNPTVTLSAVDPAVVEATYTYLIQTAVASGSFRAVLVPLFPFQSGGWGNPASVGTAAWYNQQAENWLASNAATLGATAIDLRNNSLTNTYSTTGNIVVQTPYDFTQYAEDIFAYGIEPYIRNVLQPNPWD